MESINSFTGEFAFLSNFHPSPIETNGVVFPTVEHAYQALKSEDPNDWVRIAELPTPGKAKRAGQKLQLRENWDTMRVGVMAALVWLKFRNDELAEKLLATGDAVLVEGNTWGDTFWGVCNGRGENVLGRILMETRQVLKGH